MNSASNKDIFLQLVKDHEKIIFKVCHSYCVSKNDREDLAQEIIYQLWKSYSTYNSAFRFSTWMYRVALNVAITFYRKGKTTIHSIDLPGHLLEMEDIEDQPGMIEENILLLQQFIHGFKELDKALILLYLEEKNYREIAEIMGISETNVATRLSRIKDQLKQKFATTKQ